MRGADFRRTVLDSIVGGLFGMLSRGALIAMTLLGAGGYCAHAALYNAQSGIRSLRLNIPDSVDTVRGILIYGNGANRDDMHWATDAELVAFAARIEFAILATGRWGRFANTENDELLLFESMISDFAATSGRPELVHAPWLPMGHSNGGQMSYGLAAKRPEKVIAFVASKGGYYSTYHPGAATLEVPGLLIAGASDTAIRRSNISTLFAQNRARGAKWAWVEEEATGHGDHNGPHLKLPFMAECYRLRYPHGQSPADGPVELRALDESEAWLVDTNSWETGFPEIMPRSAAEIDPLAYGWIANKKLAMLYRAFAARHKASADRATISTPVPVSQLIHYVPPIPEHLVWSEVEAFVDHHSLGSVSNGATAAWSVNLRYGGVYTFHAIITLPDQSKRCTYLNRVTVDGPFPQNIFEQWLYDQAAPPLQAPNAIDPCSGAMQIDRFIFEMDDRANNFPALKKDPQTGEFKFGYTIRPNLGRTGVAFSAWFSSDLEHWEALENLADEEGDSISVPIPVAGHPLGFFKFDRNWGADKGN